MSDELPEDFPQAVNCAHCKGVLRSGTSMTGGPTFKKGAIIICAHCGKVNVVMESSLRLMTRGEFESLDAESKMNVVAGVSAVRAALEGNGKN